MTLKVKQMQVSLGPNFIRTPNFHTAITTKYIIILFYDSTSRMQMFAYTFANKNLVHKAGIIQKDWFGNGAFNSKRIQGVSALNQYIVFGQQEPLRYDHECVSEQATEKTKKIVEASKQLFISNQKRSTVWRINDSSPTVVSRY